MSIAEKLTTIAENVPRVYEAGKTAEWSEFWDMFQQNGARTVYDHAFRNWNNAIFKPKYDIIIKNGGSYQTFYSQPPSFTGLSGDLAQLLKDLGVKLDTSGSTDVRYLFYGNSNLTKLPEISMITASSAERVVGGCSSLETIEKLVFGRKTTTLSRMFDNCNALVNVTAEGEIVSSINISAATNLSMESAKSFLLCLVDYSGTANEFAYDVKLAQEVWDKLALEGNTSPNGNTWEEYVSDKCWNT